MPTISKNLFIVSVLLTVIIVSSFGMGNGNHNQDYRKVFSLSANKLVNYIETYQKGKIVGVLSFDASSTDTSILISDIYAYYLQKNGIKILDRKELGKILKEIKLSMAGITEAKDAKKIGKLSGADLLLTGNMKELGNIYFINVKLIDVSTGETVFMDTLSFEDKEFITIKRVDEYFAEKKYPLTAAYRSALIPGWGQFYNDQPIKAYSFMVSTLGSVGMSVYYYLQYQKYTNTTSEGEDAVRDQQIALNEFNKFEMALGIGLSLWVINIIDAYINAGVR